MSKLLLMVTAFAEVGTGVALIIAPSLLIELLLGEGLSSSQSVVLGRITGAALLSIGAACWLVSQGDSGGQRGLVAGVLLYNVAVPVLLIHAATVLGMRGIALWPASVLHVCLAIWCILCLRRRSQ